MIGGRLRHRITLLRPVDPETQTGAGEVVPEFEVWVEDLPAEIMPFGSREYFGAQQVQSDATSRIRIRWMPGLHERLRVRHELTEFSPPEVEEYDIESIQPDKTLRKEVWLMVKNRSTEGFRQ